VNRERLPPNDSRIEMLRLFFLKVQRQAYEGGKSGVSQNVAIGQIIFKNIGMKEHFTLGVMKCLADEWNRGNDERTDQEV
jgi:hypothetical protein